MRKAGRRKRKRQALDRFRRFANLVVAAPGYHRTKSKLTFKRNGKHVPEMNDGDIDAVGWFGRS